MGCWNKTCGFSNLPITWAEPTYVFVLEGTGISRYNQCHSTAMYRPVIAPFTADYDDYGAGDNASGPWLPFLMDSLRSKLIEKSVGENPYHDVAVSNGKDCFGVNEFFETTQKCRLEVRGYGEPAPVSFTMMRKDIIDELLAKFKVEQWCLGSRETKVVTFPEVSDCIEDFASRSIETYASLVNKCKESVPKKPHLEGLSGKDIEAFAHTAILMGNPGYGLKVDKVDNSPITMFFGGYGGNSLSSILKPQDTILEQIALCARGQGDFSGLLALIKDWLKGEFVRSMMETYRKSWYPGFHEGSQSMELDAYVLLYETMLDCTKRQIAAYEDDSDD